MRKEIGKSEKEQKGEEKKKRRRAERNRGKRGDGRYGCFHPLDQGRKKGLIAPSWEEVICSFVSLR